MLSVLFSVAIFSVVFPTYTSVAIFLIVCSFSAAIFSVVCYISIAIFLLSVL